MGSVRPGAKATIAVFLVLLCTPFALAQDEALALARAQRFLEGLGMEWAQARVTERRLNLLDDGVHYYVVSTADCEVHVKPEPLEVWGFVTYQEVREGTEVRDLESAVQVAREFCLRGGWPEFPLDLQHSRSPEHGKEGDAFFVSLRAVPPRPYGGSSDSIAISVRPEDGAVERATAYRGHTYAEAEVRLTEDEAAARALPRVTAVYGLEAVADSIEGPVWLPDPPEGDAARRTRARWLLLAVV